MVALDESGTSEPNLISCVLDLYKQQHKENKFFGYLHY